MKKLTKKKQAEPKERDQSGEGQHSKYPEPGSISKIFWCKSNKNKLEGSQAIRVLITGNFNLVDWCFQALSQQNTSSQEYRTDWQRLSEGQNHIR